MTVNPEAKRFADALMAARQAAGEPPYKQLAREAFLALGDEAPTEVTIRHYHAGRVTPERAEIALVAFLARRYGVTLADLSEVVARRAERTLRLLTPVGAGPPEGTDPLSRCTAALAA